MNKRKKTLLDSIPFFSSLPILHFLQITLHEIIYDIAVILIN